MWYTFELIPHCFEGSVSVLCYQSVLTVCYKMEYWNSYTCVSWVQTYQMRRVQKRALTTQVFPES